MPIYHFDKTIPFTDITFQLLAGNGVLDQAIEILEMAEARHHLQIWYSCDDALDDLRYVPIDNQPLTISRLQTIIADPEAMQQNLSQIDMDDPKTVQSLKNLHGFLSETSCIIQGLDFTNDHFILFSGSLLFSAS